MTSGWRGSQCEWNNELNFNAIAIIIIINEELGINKMNFFFWWFYIKDENKFFRVSIMSISNLKKLNSFDLKIFVIMYNKYNVLSILLKNEHNKNLWFISNILKFLENVVLPQYDILDGNV